jgi:cytochrome b561
MRSAFRFFLTLLVARFLFMRATRPTALLSDTPKNMKLLTGAGHLGTYVSLSLIAISGLAIGGLYWSGVKSGGAMASSQVRTISINLASRGTDKLTCQYRSVL